VDAVDPDVDVALGRETVEADSPLASLPSSALSASSNAPVEMPLR
jgi:hypothetical protein